MPGSARGFGFPRRFRVLLRRDFNRVFTQGIRYQEGPFIAVCSPNNRDHPRLGLALRRKALPRAVDRNRIKRLAREAFRQKGAILPPLDIVISMRVQGADQERHDLRVHLERLLTRLVAKGMGSSSV
ncbi:MAG: ribonuclease P protein component [Deltaproteobacteria bacterium]